MLFQIQEIQFSYLLTKLTQNTHTLHEVKSLSCVQLFVTHGLQPTRPLCPWDFPSKNTGVGCHFFLQGIFPGIEPGSPTLQAEALPSKPPGKSIPCMLLLLLSCFSRIRLCATPQTAAHQAPQSLGFSRQEHWSGVPSLLVSFKKLLIVENFKYILIEQTTWWDLTQLQS